MMKAAILLASASLTFVTTAGAPERPTGLIPLLKNTAEVGYGCAQLGLSLNRCFDLLNLPRDLEPQAK